MALTKRKKKFAECVFRYPNKRAVMDRLNITESNFDYLMQNDEVIKYLDELYQRNKRVAAATSYGALIANIGELNGLVIDEAQPPKARIAAAREIRETQIQLREQAATDRIIDELDRATAL